MKKLPPLSREDLDRFLSHSKAEREREAKGKKSVRNYQPKNKGRKK